ncbi:glycoside hydrolase family 28 protein [Teredinibacter turnerae]|uniref:glycoside hydrolase family 28 protein n=1 Tax=Teredinibacter turnerae TaxID=2426 RepID=UPI0030CE7021
MKPITRRQLLQATAAFSLPGCHNLSSLSPPVDWATAQTIDTAVQPPVFPDKQFDIRHYGAVADGHSISTGAINSAIIACHKAGGGRVLVPAGHYLTGAVHLLSNVELHLAENARLSFSRDPNDYLPAVFTRWEGVEYMGYSPLIYAYQAENIGITGTGVLDGSASEMHWWPWKGTSEWARPGFPSQDNSRAQLFAQAEAGVPPRQRHYSEGHYLRPPFIQPYQCRNVLLEDVTIINAPFWLVHPVLCDNVTARRLHLQSLGPNSDGCNPESCRNVLIEHCFFDTGDDCIAIKSGRNADGRRLNIPSENIVIRHCEMRAGHGGVVIGSEISGGVRNVYAHDNRMSSPDLERGFRIKTNSVRGGLIENIYLRDIQIGQVKDAIVINFHYEEGDAGKFDPTVRNINLDNISCEHAQQVFQIRGFDRAPIKQLSITNSTFNRARSAGVIEHVDGLTLSGVSVNGKPYGAAT